MRSRCLISSAVSKPSMPGIWTSSRITAKSSSSSCRSASSPELARDELAGRAARGSPRARAGSPGGRRRAGRWPAARHRRGARLRRPAASTQRRDLRERRRTRRRRRRRCAAAGIARLLGGRPGPARSRSPPRAPDRAARPAAPSSLAPVRTTPIDAGAVGVGGRSRSSTSIDGRLKRTRSSVESAKRVRARRAGGSRAARGSTCRASIALLVLGLAHAAAATRAASRSRRAARRASRRAVLRDDDRQRRSRAGSPASTRSTALQAAPRARRSTISS